MIIAVSQPITSRAFVGGSVEVLRTYARTKQTQNTGFTAAYTCPTGTIRKKKVDHTFAALQVLGQRRAP